MYKTIMSVLRLKHKNAVGINPGSHKRSKLVGPRLLYCTVLYCARKYTPMTERFSSPLWTCISNS